MEKVMSKNKMSKRSIVIIGSLLLALIVLFMLSYKYILDQFGFFGDPIQHASIRVPHKDARVGIKDCRNVLKIGTEPIEMLAARISTSAIKTDGSPDKLQLEEIVNTCSCIGANTCISTYTLPGVQVYYAITENDITGNMSFKLYFKPAIFCRSDSKYGQGGHYYGRYTKCFLGEKYYEYNGSDAFVEASASVDDDIKRYRDKIDFTREESNSAVTTHTFYYGRPDFYCDDITSDVRSVIFPLEEITDLCDGYSEVCFWNYIERLILETNNGDKMYVKHALLLSTGDVTTNVLNWVVSYNSSRFSNLSHLCPPSCNGDEFTFSIRSQKTPTISSCQY